MKNNKKEYNIKIEINNIKLDDLDNYYNFDYIIYINWKEVEKDNYSDDFSISSEEMYDLLMNTDYAMNEVISSYFS